MNVTLAERIAVTVLAKPEKVIRGAATARALLLTGVIAGAGLAASLPADTTASIDPDLVRLIRFMAALKGGLLVAALWAGVWRLERPAPVWRMAVYIAAPALMAFGTLALWRLQAFGPAAATLHLGLVAFLAASLTDKDFIPSPGAT